MGYGPVRYVTPPVDPWGVFERQRNVLPRPSVYENELPPTPWIFRRDPFFVLVAMIGIWLGIVVGIWLAKNGLGG